MKRTDRRALFIAPVLPSPHGNGLAIRLAMFADALDLVARTDILCIPVFGDAGDATWVRQRGFESKLVDPSGREDTRYRLGRLEPDARRRIAAFRSYGRTSLEAKLSLPVLAEVRNHGAANRYDLVHVARGYLMRSTQSWSGVPLTVDLDEDDAWSWRSLGRIGASHDAAWNRAEAAAADRSLAELWEQFGAVFISGPADRHRLARRHPGLNPIVIANPAPDTAPLPRRDDGHTVLFVGSFGYLPNRDGISWFIDAVWPLVHAARPAARLRIVGRDLPDSVKGSGGQRNIEPVGAVDDLAPDYASASIAIAPLRAGGGTRIKLIEAAAFGVPIVSTRLAARGLSFGTAESLWLADTAEAFAAAMVDALDHPEERQRRSARALALVGHHHQRSRLVEELACRFAGLLDR